MAVGRCEMRSARQVARARASRRWRWICKMVVTAGAARRVCCSACWMTRFCSCASANLPRLRPPSATVYPLRLVLKSFGRLTMTDLPLAQ